MENNFNASNKIEKVVEENSLLILLDNKVIIKSNKEKIGIDLHAITNVRLVKHRDLSPSIFVLVNLLIFYVFYFSPLNLNATTNFVCGIGITAVFIISLSIKKYTYKLVINQSKLRFNKITISKSNRIHAANFIQNFANKESIKNATPETAFYPLMEVF